MTTVLRLPVHGVFAATLAMVALCSGVASADTWNWHVSGHGAGKAAMDTKSTITLSAHDVLMTYSAHVGSDDIPISSCRAQLSDIAEVRIENLAIGTYMFVAMKPQRGAACASGLQASALVPIGTDSAAAVAVSSVAHACCGVPALAVARATASPAPSPRAVAIASPRAVPSATPRAVASATPRAVALASEAPANGFIAPLDWVENQGVFSFVRIRNRDRQPVTIAHAAMTNCRNVVSGCANFSGRSVTLPPKGTVTLATVISGSADGAAFSYTYDANVGAQHYAGSGTAAKGSTSDSNVALKAWQIRQAEAAAIAGLGASSASHVAAQPAAPVQPAYVAPRLTQRGSTRLGIGQRGVAVLRVSISANGMPQNAAIVSISNRALVAAALETAVSSSYAPASRNGRPASADYIATFQFDGDDPALASTPVWRRPVNSPADATSSTPAPSPAPSAVPVSTPAATEPPKLPPPPIPSPAGT